MNANKITQVHVYLIGGVLMILIAAGLYFLLLKPLYEENAILQQSIQGTETASVNVAGGSFTIAQIKEAEKKLQQAKVQRDAKERQLNSIMATKTLPPSEAIDLGRTGQPAEVLTNGTMERWLQLPRVIVTKMENFTDRAARKHGVKVTHNFQAPAPTTDPNSLPKRPFAWNLGNMTAEGEFNRVMRWAQEFNNAPLLSSVDGLKVSLAGRGGRVKSTASLTVFIFPKGAAAASTSAAAPAAGAAPGGVSNPMPFGMPAGGPAGTPSGTPPGMGAAADPRADR